METSVNNSDESVKISVILKSYQYKELVKKVAERKINNEKGVGLGSLIREAVNHYYVEKKYCV